jgi:hypothetical protein
MVSFFSADRTICFHFLTKDDILYEKASIFYCVQITFSRDICKRNTEVEELLLVTAAYRRFAPIGGWWIITTRAANMQMTC